MIRRITSVSWNDEVCWWVPPLYLVSRVIKHAKACAAMGTLIVPAWRSAPFWPMLCTDGVHFAGFVRRWTKIKYHDYLIRDGRSGNNIGSAMNTDTDILAIFIDFASKPRLFKAGFCTFDSLVVAVHVHFPGQQLHDFIIGCISQSIDSVVCYFNSVLCRA